MDIQERKFKKATIILLLIIGFILIGLISPFFLHEKSYVISKSIKLTVIDVNKNVNIENDFDYALFTCIERDLKDLKLPINILESIFFLRRITITDKITDEYGNIYYKLDYITLFNIKYKKGVMTEKIDLLLINRGCR